MKSLSTNACAVLLLFGTVTMTSTLSKETTSSRFSADEFLVKGLDEIEPAFRKFDGEMHAGLLPIDDDSCAGRAPFSDERDVIGENQREGEIMFWLFEPKQPVSPDTLVIWLNGGPGASSFDGGFFENAPITTPPNRAGAPPKPMDIEEKLSYNEYSWTNATNMLFVENPVGTGFSHGPFPHTEFDVSRDFYNFLMHFFCTFSHMKGKKLYIFGESYAGMYVPSIAHRIYLNNQERSKEHHSSSTKGNGIIHLAGIAIGNGWMNAMVQGPTVINYAWWHGIIDITTRDALHAKWDDCISGVPMEPPFHDFTVTDECGIVEAVVSAAGGGLLPGKEPNQYDITTWSLYPALENPNSAIVQFFNNPKVKKALHAPANVTWTGSMPGANRRRQLHQRRLKQKNKNNVPEDFEELPGKYLLIHDRPISVVPYIAELLDETKIRVLIYNGDRDMCVNSQGSEMLLDTMEWTGAEKWKNARRSLWMVNGDAAGYSKKYQRLEFLVVLNSGHLVPHNVPVQALDLVTRMVTNKSYSDINLPSFANINKGKKYHNEKILSPTTTTKTTNEYYDNFSELRFKHVLFGICVLVLDFLAGMYCYVLLRRRYKKKHKYQRLPDVDISSSPDVEFTGHPHEG